MANAVKYVQTFFTSATMTNHSTTYPFLAYCVRAAQQCNGPRNRGGERWIANWKSHVLKMYGSNDDDALRRAYAEVIVGEYARRYGDKVDGWWFDHARFGDLPLLRDVIKKANPNAILAFNVRAYHAKSYKRILKRTGTRVLEGKNPCADYTAGHPTPLRAALPGDDRNLGMIESIEATEDGFFYADGGGGARLGHVFMPVHARWNDGDDVAWTEDRAAEWMRRVVKSGGAWTWNVPLLNSASRLKAVGADFAGRVNARLRTSDEGDGGDEL